MGYKQADMWIVELNEDQWYGLDKTDTLTMGARVDARNNGCNMAAIFVTPDPVFPMCGQERRHRVYYHDLRSEREQTCGFKVSAVMTAELDTARYENGNERERKRMMQLARDAVNEAANGTPGRYVIQYVSTGRGLVVLERGKV
jgi:hypothetical protein